MIVLAVVAALLWWFGAAHADAEDLCKPRVGYHTAPLCDQPRVSPLVVPALGSGPEFEAAVDGQVRRLLGRESGQ